MKTLALIVTSLLLISCGEGGSGSSPSNPNGSGGGNVGYGGSYSTFSIVNNNLYVMDVNSVVSFELNQQGDPDRLQQYDIYSQNGETLFNYQNSHLMVGKNTGVEVLKMGENGAMSFVSEYVHFTACDPVVAQGNRAFTTLSLGTCQNANAVASQERLDVLDITDINNPTLIFSLPLISPKGLAVQNEHLFVCVRAGLKQYQIVDNNDGFELEQVFISDVYPCDDIILTSDRLILKHSQGITQLSWVNNELELLSQIEKGVFL